MTHQSVEKKLHFVENDLFGVFIMRHVKNKILTYIYMQNSDGNLLKTAPTWFFRMKTYEHLIL